MSKLLLQNVGNMSSWWKVEVVYSVTLEVKEKHIRLLFEIWWEFVHIDREIHLLKSEEKVKVKDLFAKWSNHVF